MADSLRLQVLLDGVDRLSGPLKRIMGGADGVKRSLRETGKALSDMNRTSKDISSYALLRAKLRGVTAAMQEQSAAAESSKAALESRLTAQRALSVEMKVARATFKQQARAFAEMKEPSAEQVAAFKAQQQAIKKLESDYIAHTAATRAMQKETMKAESHLKKLTRTQSEQSDKVEAARQKLEAAGISTAQMATRQRALRGDMRQTNAAIDQQKLRLERLNKLQATASTMKRGGMTATLHGAGFLAAGQGALRAAAAPLGAAMQFESAMADVKKVVNFDTPQQFAQMGSDIQKLSMRLPMTSTEISKIVAAAGQANIPRQELLRFAEDATKMGVAFDTTAEDAGQTMATWRTAFRMTQADVVTMADKINYLGNTGPASVQKITDVVNRIGALGEVAGLKSGPLAALASTVAGMGIESEVSATGIKNMLLTLAAGDSATKSQRASFQRLGIDAKQMAVSMQRDAGGAILSVLDKIKQLPQAEQAAVMTKLFGRESIGAIAPLLTNLDLLKTNLGKVSNAQIYGGSMAQEYASRVATSENSLQLLKNTALVLSQVVGKTLIPDFKAFAERTGAVVARIVDWSEKHPALVGMLAKTAIVGAALVTVLGGLLVTGGMAAMGFSQIYKAVGLIANSGALTSITSGLSNAGRLLPMLANGARMLVPLIGGISAPLLLVGGLIAATALLVWKYWQPIKAWLTGFGQGIMVGLSPMFDDLSAKLGWIAEGWRPIGEGIRWVGGLIAEFFTPIRMTSKELQGVTDAGRSFGMVFGNVIGAVAAAVGTVFNFVGTTIGNTAGFILTSLGGIWDVLAGIFTGNGARIVAGFRAMWLNVDQFFGGLPAKLAQFGVNMVQGLVNGIRSMFGAPGRAFAEIATNGITKFKALLGINSPSRVFAQFGDYTMQGYANGLDRSGRAPMQAITGVGQRLRAAGAGLALAATAPVMAAGAGGPATSGGGATATAGAATTHLYEIHIHAAPGMNPGEIARAVAAELDRRERQRGAVARSRLSDID